MHRRTMTIVAAFVVLFSIAPLAVGCAPTAAVNPPPPATLFPGAPTSGAAANVSDPANPTAGALTVVDSARRTVVIPKAPARIISLAPSVTEIVFALGLGERLVAVDNHSDFPPEVKTLPHFQTYPLNLEQLVSFNPDLVLAGSITSQEEIVKMQDLKLNVLVVGTSTSSFDSVLTDIALVGEATGQQAKAERITDTMTQRLTAIRSLVAKATSRPRVYWELDATDPGKPFTPGPGSFVDELITLAGGTNVASNAKSTWAQVNSEEIVAANPEVIIMSDVAYGISVESLRGRSGWGTIQAVRANRVFPIDDNLVSRQGPRIVDGLEAAAKLIHPELFQ